MNFDHLLDKTDCAVCCGIDTHYKYIIHHNTGLDSESSTDLRMPSYKIVFSFDPPVGSDGSECSDLHTGADVDHRIIFICKYRFFSFN